MELEFQHALFLAGAVLIFTGLISSAANMGMANPDLGVLDALSHGFMTTFFALFSGVLIGVGFALVSDGLLLKVKSDPLQIGISLSLCVVCAAGGLLAIAKPEYTSFATLVVFFAGLTAGGAFMLSAFAFALSDALRIYLTGKGKRKK